MRLITAIAVSIALFAGPVSAADVEQKAPSAAEQALQQKKAKCNAETKAQNLTPTKSKAYMSGCMATKQMPSKPSTAQAEKRKECTKQAGDKELKGGARKAFIRSCMKA